MKELMNPSLITVLFLLLASSVAEDVFSCHGNVGFFRMKKENERGAIYPRADVIVEVSGEPQTVLCRFNDAAIDQKDVFFRGIDNTVLNHQVVNSSTIQVNISHSNAAKYRLQCVLRRSKGEKVLCKQFVKAGYPPHNIVQDSLRCVSQNYESLNCSWQYEDNPITTTYTPQYSVPKFIHETPCLTNNGRNMCYWGHETMSSKLRDKFYLHFHGSNTLGKREFTRQINIPEAVIPNKVSTSVTLIEPKTAKIEWNLSFPIDVFLAGLWHKIDYRLAGDETWETVELMNHTHLVTEMIIKRQFDVKKELPLANAKYEFRVRLHTMAASIEKNLWSDFNVASVYTEAMLPSTPPKTDLSSFEVVEYLDRRDVFVNFQNVDPKFYSGNNFKYKIKAYSATSNTPLQVRQTDVSGAYVKYPMMDFNEIRFKIWPENEIGVGAVFSEVIVPKYVCMPKKTDFFTVIIHNHNSSNQESKVFSLYWVPSKQAEERCPGGSPNIDFYTIFWCKNTYGDRCKEKLFWTDVTDPRVVSHEFSALSGANSSLYEKNITGLSEGSYTFGVAAVSGKYSSGIRWSRCIVFESDSPPAPSNVNAYAEDLNSVRLTWELKCPSLSAVPLGFKIVYCKSKIADFGHCTSKEESTIINKPNAKSHILTDGLQPGVSYIFSVSLISYVGEGKQSSPVQFEMNEEKPIGPPISFRYDSVENSSAILSWFRPDPFLRNGNISKFCLYPDHVFKPNNCLQALESDVQMYKVENLSPFTEYTLEVAACTAKGCGDNFKAAVTFKTKTGTPKPVEKFALDVSNWRLEWDWNAGLCNSRKCTFDITIPVNDTFMIEEIVEGYKYLSLYDLGLPCLQQDITFSIRPIGISEYNQSIYGEWTSASKAANECPPVSLPMWLIGVIGSIGMIIAAFVFLIFVFGWRSVMEVVKACTEKIEVPKGILEDTIKDKKNDHKKDKKFLNANHDSLIKMSQKTVLPAVTKESLPQDDKPWARSPRTSVSSEEIQLIPSNGDRHGRNASGSSNRSSSNQDSAVMSQSSSTVEPDFPLSQNAIPQRLSDFTYVQHGILPHKIPEGYVAARSVPSLPSLLKSNETDGLQSTPNLNSATAATVMEMEGARRASTGYISMVNSDNGKVSPSQIDAVVFAPNTYTIPPYTKHGVRLSHDAKSTAPNYVTLRQAPNMFCSKNGYVPPEAYCKVAERDIPRNNSTSKEEKTFTNPYVAVADSTFMFGTPEKIPAYVQLTDANRWTAPVPEKNSNQEMTSHVKDLIHEMTPSLSKQSSGYVSQEALMQEIQSDQVVMSPKRLAVHGQRPHSLVFPVPSQQSSMV